jgi:hypothetical protein
LLFSLFFVVERLVLVVPPPDIKPDSGEDDSAFDDVLK